MTSPTVKISIPAATRLEVDLDVDTFGKFFSDCSDHDQAAILSSMVDHMARHFLQWDYVAIEIERLSDPRRVKDVLALLARGCGK